MYCKNCGKPVDQNARFCPGCGTPVAAPSSSSAFSASSDNPVLVLKPRFIPWVTMVSILPFQIFFTLWGGMFFGGFGMFAVKALRLDLPAWFTFVFFGCLFFFGLPILAYTAKKNTYTKTEYRFFRDRLDYYEGFYTVEEKTISYRNITEVNLSKGVIQKSYGLGTIVLSTPATGYESGTSRSGIRVADIENPDEVYRQVKELVSRVQ